MTISPHLLTGAALATQTDSSLVAFLLGFASHFVLDAIPHVDPGTFIDPPEPHRNRNLNMETIHAHDKPWPTWLYVFVIVEFLTMILILSFFKSRLNFEIIIAGSFGAILIDILDSPLFRFILKLPGFKQLHWLHHRVHFDLDPKIWYWGLPVEIIIIVASLWVLFK